MFEPKTWLAAVTFAALAATPVLAVDMSADVALGAAPQDMTTVKAVEDSAFVGNEVRTKDQIVIGLVDAVYEGPDGAPMAVVALKSDIAAQSPVKTFTVPLASDMTADGSLTLAWTQGELFAALSSNLTTDANKDSDDAADKTDDKSDDTSGG